MAKIQPSEGGYQLEGVIDHTTAPALFKQPLSAEAETIRLNMAAVEKVDSAGVALLLHWTQSLKKRGQQLTLENADPQLMQMVGILSLESQLNFV